MPLDENDILDLYMQSQLDQCYALVAEESRLAAAITVGGAFDPSIGRHCELLDAVGMVALDAIKTRKEALRMNPEFEHLEGPDSPVVPTPPSAVDLANIARQHKDERAFFPGDCPGHRLRPTHPAAVAPGWLRRQWWRAGALLCFGVMGTGLFLLACTRPLTAVACFLFLVAGYCLARD